MRIQISRSLPRLFFSTRKPAAGPPIVGAFLGQDELKGMFETIGGSYDLQNHILSLWQDKQWRKRLVDAVRPQSSATIYDLAIGTGDIAIPIARRYPGVQITGVDNSPRMLAVARRKISFAGLDERITLVQADMRATPLDSASADIVTSAFTLRNLPDRNRVLTEFHRLLRPGGRLLVLEPAIPTILPVRLIYQLYFDHIMPFLGNLLSRTDYAYSYLKESIHAFPCPEQFLGELRDNGFRELRWIPLSYGTAILYLGKRVRQQVEALG